MRRNKTKKTLPPREKRKGFRSVSQRPGVPFRIGSFLPAPSPSPLVPNGPQDKRSSRRRLLKADAFHDLSSSSPQFSRLASPVNLDSSTLSPRDTTKRRRDDRSRKGQNGLFLRHHPLRPNPPLRNLMARLPLRPLRHPRPPRSSPPKPNHPPSQTNPRRPSTPSPPPSSSSAGNAPTPPTTASPPANASATSRSSPTGV